MGLRSKIMGRQLIENLPRTKLIYNQYTLTGNTARAHNLIYTVPTGKKALINFKYATVGKVNTGSIRTFAIQLAAQKYSSSPKLHSIIAVGKYSFQSSASDGQMITLRNPHDYLESSIGATFSVGAYNQGWWGSGQAKYMQNAYNSSDNSLQGQSSNDQFSPQQYNSNSDPWNGSQNSAAAVDAQKDFILEAGEELYYFYRVENYSSYQSGQRTDVMVEVKEIEGFA